MDFPYKLIAYKSYTYNGKDYIKLFIFCKDAEYTTRLVKLSNSELIEFCDDNIDRDITQYLTFKVTRDGITRLDISI